MAVTQEITHLDNSAVKLTFTYNNEDLRTKYNEIVSGFAKDLQIKGFRKGKVPIPILERKLGKALQDDVLNTIIGNAVSDALKGEDFPKDATPLAYSAPEVEGEPKLDLAGELVFSVKYDVTPVVTIKKWEGFEVEVNTADITDADVNSKLDEIRERNAIVMDKESSAEAEKGDIVTVNYSELSESGDEIPGTKREDFSFNLGSEHNIFKFDDEISGMKKDETRDIQKTYPEDFDNAELAGKTKKIRITLTSVKQRELPDDDELAQDVDERFKTIDDLKKNIKDDLVRTLESRIRSAKIGKIIEKIVEQDPFPIPESMIKQESIFEFRRSLGNYSIKDDEAYNIISTFKDETYRLNVIKKIQTALIMDKLKNELNIQVSDEDMEAGYKSIAEDEARSLDEIKELYEKNEDVKNYMAEEIIQNKLIDLLLEKNTIKEGKKVNSIDILSGNS